VLGKLEVGEASTKYPDVTPLVCKLPSGISLGGALIAKQGVDPRYQFSINRWDEHDRVSLEDLYGLNDIAFKGQVDIDISWLASLPNWLLDIKRGICGQWSFEISSSISLSDWNGDINPFQCIRFISRDIGGLPGRDAARRIIWFDSDGHIYINSYFVVPDNQDPIVFLNETITGIRNILLGYEEIPAIDPGSEYFHGTLSIGRSKGFTLDYSRIYLSLSSLIRFRWNKDYHSLAAGVAVLLVWLGSVFITVYVENLLD